MRLPRAPAVLSERRAVGFEYAVEEKVLDCFDAFRHG